MIRLIFSIITIGFFTMNTFAQHNSKLITHSSDENTKHSNGSAIELILDSEFTLEEALNGQRIPASKRIICIDIFSSYNQNS